ncbi:MAG: nitrous oxide reductase accessory protein NosL [Thermodesulfobacteriota bacterium]
MASSIKVLPVALVLFVALTALTTEEKIWASESLDLPNGSKLQLGKTCPVCGMKVGGELESPAIFGYQEGRLTAFAGAAVAVFQDGKVVGFDGAHCLFVYNTIPKRFGIDVTKIARSFVVDFETKKFIDANQAFLVLGTSIRGFMGYALVPFTSRERAEAFKKEYGGKEVVQLHTATPDKADR